MLSISSTLPMIQTPRISSSLDRPPVILQDAPQVKEKTGVVKNTEGTLPALAAAGNKISKDKLPDKLPALAVGGAPPTVSFLCHKPLLVESPVNPIFDGVLIQPHPQAPYFICMPIMCL